MWRQVSRLVDGVAGYAYRLPQAPLRKAPKLAILEPDECYLIGDQARDTPDLAIEVVWTSGGIDKLEIYRRLGVREVWRWKDSRIEVYVLREQHYESRSGARFSRTSMCNCSARSSTTLRHFRP